MVPTCQSTMGANLTSLFDWLEPAYELSDLQLVALWAHRCAETAYTVAHKRETNYPYLAASEGIIFPNIVAFLSLAFRIRYLE